MNHKSKTVELELKKLEIEKELQEMALQIPKIHLYHLLAYLFYAAGILITVLGFPNRFIIAAGIIVICIGFLIPDKKKLKEIMNEAKLKNAELYDIQKTLIQLKYEGHSALD